MKGDDAMNIAENIKKFRLSMKMEQQDLADRLHISNKTVSSWECGRTEPKMGMIEAMAEIFGCSKTDLIDGLGNQDDTEQELIMIFRLMNAEGKDDLIKYARYLSTRYEYKKKNHQNAMVRNAL